MDALIVYPENEEQMDALKAVIKTMRITFEQKSIPYPDHVIAGVQDSLKESEDKSIPFTGIKEMLDQK